MTASRRKRGIAAPAAIAIALVVLVLAAEAFARLGLGLGTPPLYEADPRFEYRLRPNQSLERFGKHIAVNRWGMRSDDFGPTKPSSDELRVLVFGDSVVNGGSVIDQADLATTRLQAALRAELSRPVVVGNVSAGSWGPGNWLGIVRAFGLLDADLVVLMVNSGDHADNPTFEPLGVDQPTHAPWLALQEAVIRYLTRYLSRLVPAATAAGERPPPEPSPQAVARGLDDLRAFLALAGAGGRAVVVVHHPDRDELASGRYQPGFDALQRVAGELGVAFVPLRERFAPVGSSIYRDAIHHTELGQRVLAAALLEVVRPLLQARVDGARRPE